MVFANNKLLAAMLLSLLAPTALANKIDQLLDMSLEELMQVRIDTATVFETSLRNQPATITLLTAQQLSAMGARNLMEALEFVPGVSFGVDVFGVIGLEFRGQWAHEGKVLLLLDDIPLNDLLYGNLNLARHYPIEQIDKIEVLRGAGSAKYGGNAQLAVIRVTSKLRTLNNTEIHLSLSAMDGTDAGKKATFQDGGTLEGGRYAISVHAAQEPWSGQTWQDTAGSKTDLSSKTEFNAKNLQAYLQWKDLRLQAFIDNHESKTPHNYGYSTLGETVRFDSNNVVMEYDWKLSDSLTVTPQYSYIYQENWAVEYNQNINPALPASDAVFPAQRNTFNLEMKKQNAPFSILAGLDYWEEKGTCDSSADLAPTCVGIFDGANSLKNHASGAYAQADWQGEPWIISMGLRYSEHSYVGTSTVPRLSVVYPLQDWQIKWQYAEAFREPNLFVIWQSDPNTNIKPEKTVQHELEFSWKLSKSWHGAVSLFSTKTTDPIIFIAQTNPFYANYDPVNTRGIETEWQWKQGSHQAFMAYSYYRVQGKSNSLYKDGNNSRQNLGIPNHKISVNYNYKIPQHSWELQSALHWYSSMSAYNYEMGADVDGSGTELALDRIDSQTFINVSALYSTKKWDATIGIYDLTDESRIYPQPYLNTSTAYPGGGREYWARFVFHF